MIDEEPQREAIPLLEPRDGLPGVVGEPAALERTVREFAAGSGPVALDAERASGYRYGQRAYLVQLRRAGAGTALIDPIACPDLSSLDAALSDAEYVLHAANQDLPCLAELGLRPRWLFDTELAGRLLGYSRVGLGTMVESLLGLILEKGYSAADWSRRPLPEEWLRYAALDVEVLVELREALEQRLAAAGKLEWARQEFATIAAAPPPKPRSEPWRRTSGIHRVRGRRALAIVRELWQERDRIAEQRDTSPGRVLPDSAIVAAAVAPPATPAALADIPGFAGRTARNHRAAWLGAIARGRGLPEHRLPELAPAHDGPPPTNRWHERDPQAAGRLSAARAMVAELAERLELPPENLVQPDAVRRLAWSPPPGGSTEAVAAQLRAAGARDWQVELVAEPLCRAMSTQQAAGSDEPPAGSHPQ